MNKNICQSITKWIEIPYGSVRHVGEHLQGTVKCRIVRVASNIVRKKGREFRPITDLGIITNKQHIVPHKGIGKGVCVDEYSKKKNQKKGNGV